MVSARKPRKLSRAAGSGPRIASVAAPAPDQLYRGATRVFAVVIVGFGLATVIVTLANGGGITSFGLLIGVLFTALGLGRLYLATRAPG